MRANVNPFFILFLICTALFVSSSAGAAPRVETLSSPNPTANGRFGSSVASVPDVNGDGHPDAVVASRNEGEGVYVFDGMTGDLLQNFLPSLSNSDETVAGIRDLNGNGSGEVIIANAVTDQVFVVDGATGALLGLVGPNFGGGGFGSSLAVLPDLTGNGFDEILVGAPDEDVLAVAAGRVYVFDSEDTAVLRTLTAPVPEAFAQFGAAVAAVPDFTGDGKADIAVGEPNAGLSDDGQVHLFNGATGAIVATLTSSADSFGHFGNAVAGLKDLTGDDNGDLLIGASLQEAGGVNDAGRAYLFAGNPAEKTHELVREFISPGRTATGRFGESVAVLKDVNDDGFDDVLIGAPFEGVSGRAYVFDGTNGNVIRAFAPPRPNVSQEFGASSSSLGDADGDGVGDLVIGAPAEQVDGVERLGRTHIFLSGEDSDEFDVSGSITDAQSGNSISCATIVATAADQTVFVAAADDRGFYAFVNLPRSDLLLTVFAPGFTSQQRAPAFDDGQAEEDFALELRSESGIIGGTVTDNVDQAPLAGVLVDVLVNGAAFDFTYTCISGNYEVAVPAGKQDENVTLVFSAPGFDTQEVEGPGEDVDVVMSAAIIPGLIAGVVTDGTSGGKPPLPNANVFVTPSFQGTPTYPRTTNEDGLYTVSNLGAGDYEVKVSAEGFPVKAVVASKTSDNQQLGVNVELGADDTPGGCPRNAASFKGPIAPARTVAGDAVLVILSIGALVGYGSRRRPRSP